MRRIQQTKDGTLVIEHLDSLQDESVLQADVCIVGAGAAGLLIARSLARTGAHIVLLESGGWAADHPTSQLSDGHSAPGTFRGLQAGRSRVFGGTTTLWGGQCIRLDPIDFERRAWVPDSGWPITYDDLVPHYEAAEAALEITEADRQVPAWTRFGVQQIALDPAALHTVHGVFIRRPDLGRRFRDELRAAPRVRVLLHATAQHLRTDPYGTAICEVDVASLSGRRASVRARRVVLCAGAIENARLLLLSDSANAAGLGNTLGLVGRYLQDHPCGRTATVHTAAPRVLQDHWNMLYGSAARYMPKLALAEVAQRSEGLLNCVGRLSYDYDETDGTRALLGLLAEWRGERRPRALAARLGHAASGLPDIARSFWRVRARGLSPAPKPRQISLEVFSEQTPNPDSRVTLTGATDVFGLRQVHVDWRLDSLTARTLAGFTRLVGREFERLGLGRLDAAAWLDDPLPCRSAIVDSYHPAGTARMSADPVTGVVDRDCQVFGVRGLYVAGSAVFPTSGAANPTLTIAAMALRLAEHLRQELAEEAPAARPQAALQGAPAPGRLERSPA